MQGNQRDQLLQRGLQVRLDQFGAVNNTMGDQLDVITEPLQFRRQQVGEHLL